MALKIWISLLVIFVGISSIQARPRTLFGEDAEAQQDIGENLLKRERRQSDGSLTTQRQAKYLISILEQLMADLSLSACEGDINKGIQCEEEAHCVPWQGICDGEQVCGMETKAGCLNQSLNTYGVPQERLCNGDENKDWCILPDYVPQTCGQHLEVPKNGKTTAYSPYFPTSYPSDIACEWSVKAPEGTRLSVNVKNFNTEENYDFINLGPGLKEQEEGGSYYIFKHSGMGLPPVPAFRTPDNELFLTFQTDMWVTHKGFEIEFADVNAYDPGVDIDNVLEDDEYNTTCGEQYKIKSDEEATVTSPGYPLNYPNKFQCDWTFSIDAGERIGVSFETLDLEPGADVLQIGKGANPGSGVVAELTGNKRPTESMLIESSKMWMRLKTDASITRLGFKATVREQPYNDCGGDVQISRDGSAVIASPQFPDVGYHLNHNCLWKITGDTERGLTAIFKEFNTEKQWDTVSMGFGSEPARDGSNYVVENWSGNKLPYPKEFMSDENKLWIHFKTDGTVIDRGWKVQIFDSNVRPSNTTVEKKQSIKPDKDCGGAFRFDASMGKAVITSPDFPYKYRPILECLWFVDIPYNGDVTIRFDQFNTEKHRDILTVGTGTNPDDESSILLDTFSGTKRPEELNTDKKKLWIKFLTDFQTEYNGWKMEIVSVPTKECGGFIEVPSNASISIASPGYPDRYLGNQNCIFTLVGPSNRRLRISVADFESENWGGVLSVGEGCRKKDHGSVVIVDRHSGFGPPLHAAFIPRTNVAWIKWNTDYERPYKGWKMVISDTGLVGDQPTDEGGDPIPCYAPGPTTQATTPAKPTPGPTVASGSGYPDWYEDDQVNEPSLTEVDERTTERIDYSV